MRKKILPLALGGLAIGTTEFVMMGILPDIARDFGITIPQAGYLISAYALGVVVGAPLLVAASSSLAPRRILFGLMCIFTVFNTLSAFSPNEYVLFAARFFAGLPHGAFFGVGSVVASRVADKGKQAQAISIMFAGLTIANLVSVPLGTYIGHHYSWRYTFGGVGLLGIVTLISIYPLLPALPVSRSGSFKSELKAFARIEPWLIFLITAIGTGGLFCWISYIAPLMTEVAHYPKANVPFVMVIAGLGMVVGNTLGGRLSDRLEPLKACLLLLLAMSASLLIIYFVSGNVVLSLIMTFIAGSCSLAVASPIQMLMIQNTKGAEMLGASVTQAAFNMANALGAFLGGIPITLGYGYRSPELVGVLMSLGGTALAWVLVKRFKQAQATKTSPEVIYG